jgi:hypothetical protein
MGSQNGENNGPSGLFLVPTLLFFSIFGGVVLKKKWGIRSHSCFLYLGLTEMRRPRGKKSWFLETKLNLFLPISEVMNWDGPGTAKTNQQKTKKLVLFVLCDLRHRTIT